MLIYTKQQVDYPGNVRPTPFTSLQMKILHLTVNSPAVILIAVVSAYQFGASSPNEIKMALTGTGYVFGKLIPYCK